MTVVLDGVRADVLRDAARFAGRDARLANRIHERGLAVIDVAHEGDDRRAQLELFRFRFLRWLAAAARPDFRRLVDARRLPCASPFRK